MIAFATLILGLFFGSRPVEVVVGEGVAAVELRLDGARVGVLREPPWVMEIDFGDELAPRHLEAVAFDAADRELGRASQWLNLPQAEAVLSAAFEPRAPGAGRVARLTWESIAGAEPKTVTASLDGRPLVVADPRRIALPPVDESQLHLLSVELVFNDLVSSRVDLTFGGAYADEVSTEMTALPLYATGKIKRPPTVADVQGWFLKDGEPLPVIVVEKGTAEIVVVMGRPFPHLVDPTGRYKPPKNLALEGDHRVRFLSPIAEQKGGVATTFELFPTSPAYDGEMGDLYILLTHMLRLPEKREPRVASAVAVAGLAAYRSRQRRAVILLPSPDSERDEITPDQARRYLEKLRVPFVVWEPENKPAAAAAVWGAAQPVGSLKTLAAAYEALAEELDRQWIVWLDGRHLPQAITLSPEAAGFVLR